MSCHSQAWPLRSRSALERATARTTGGTTPSFKSDQWRLTGHRRCRRHTFRPLTSAKRLRLRVACEVKYSTATPRDSRLSSLATCRGVLRSLRISEAYFTSPEAARYRLGVTDANNLGNNGTEVSRELGNCALEKTQNTQTREWSVLESYLLFTWGALGGLFRS